MSIKEKNAKGKIIKTTIDLLRTEPLEKITMRRIAKDAKVTLSSINYYFQSKEKLIDIAIENAFFSVVGTWDDVYTNVSGDPLTKLKKLFISGAKFIETYPRIAKISILRDLTNPTINDNSSQLSFAYLGALKDIYGNEKSEQELLLLAHILISASQMAILKADVLKKTTGYDITKEQERNFVSNFFFDTIIQKR
jgi:AcrR family transcriptional regulator